jgi:hypothetical protein
MIIIVGIEISINNCGPDPNPKYHLGRITNKVSRNMADTFRTMLNRINFFIEFIVCWIANPLYLVVVFHFWFIEFFLPRIFELFRIVLFYVSASILLLRTKFIRFIFNLETGTSKMLALAWGELSTVILI